MSGGASPPHGGVLAARTLRAHDVDMVFSLNGGHIWALYDGCVQEGIRLVDTRHEQTAAFAAEGWAKVTRRVGVAALTAGPGVTNGVSAITSAWLNGTPMFVIGGRAPDRRWGQGSLQEIDHVPIVASITKVAETAHGADAIPAAFDRTLRAARTPHRAPTFVDVPLDGWGPSDAVAPDAVAPSDLVGDPPDSDAIARVAALLARAERPVLLVGSDVYWAGAEAETRALVEGAGLPAFANDMGRGVLPADHPLAFSRARSTAFKSADLIVVAGTPLDFRLSFGRYPDAAVVHLADTAQGVAAHAELAASVAGDLRATLASLAAQVGGRAPADWCERLHDEERAARAADEPRLASNASPIDPVRVYGELRARLARDAIVVGDGGDFVSYAGRYVDTYTPGCFLGPGPYGCLGSGTGYALAASLAHPERQTVVLLRRRRARVQPGRPRLARPSPRERGRHRRQQRDLGAREAPDAGHVRLRRAVRPRARDPVRPGCRGPRLPRRAGRTTRRARARARPCVRVRRPGAGERPHRPGRRVPALEQPRLTADFHHQSGVRRARMSAPK